LPVLQRLLETTALEHWLSSAVYTQAGARSVSQPPAPTGGTSAVGHV
jgi:hypothetical protein